MNNVFKAFFAVGLAVAVVAPGSAFAFVEAGQTTGQTSRFVMPEPPFVPTQTAEQIAGVPYPVVAADGFYGNVARQLKDNLSQSNKRNYFADLAIDASGNAGAVWEQFDPITRKTEVFATFWNGSAWRGKMNPNGPDNISATPTAYSGSASIAFDRNDNPMIAWSEENNGNGEARFVRWNGSAWRGMNGVSPFDVVDAGEATWPGRLSMAVNPTNGYPAIAMGGIFVMRWNGSTWNGFTGAAYDFLSAGSSRSHSQPVIKFGTNGVPHVAWFVQGSYFYDRSIYYARFNGTSWSGLAGGTYDAVNAGTGHIEGMPDLAIESGTGVPAIAWGGTDGGSQIGIVFKHWNGGMWRGHNAAPFDFITDGNQGANNAQLSTAINGTIGIAFVGQDYNAKYVRWTGSSWRGISQQAPQLIGPISPGGVADLEMDYFGLPNVLGVIGDNPNNEDQVNIYFTRWKDFPSN